MITISILYTVMKIILKISQIIQFLKYMKEIQNKFKGSNPMIYDTWSDQNQSLAQALATEKNVMFIILFFIILISSYNNFKSNFLLKKSTRI